MKKNVPSANDLTHPQPLPGGEQSDRRSTAVPLLGGVRGGFIFCVAFLLSALTTSAHYVWIEDTRNHQLVVRFAEWPDEYEVSPGHLDEVSVPDAWKLGADGNPVQFTVKKKSDKFQIAGASSANVVQAETGYQVMSATNKPSRKPIFYARWHPAGAGAAKPALNFDIVPTANSGEFQVYFRSEPVAGVKVTAHLPDGKEQELTADEKGIVHFTADKPGLYMLSAKHQRESVKGYSGGEFYDVISHNCSVAWRQP